MNVVWVRGGFTSSNEVLSHKISLRVILHINTRLRTTSTSSKMSSTRHTYLECVRWVRYVSNLTCRHTKSVTQLLVLFFGRILFLPLFFLSLTRLEILTYVFFFFFFIPSIHIHLSIRRRNKSLVISQKYIYYEHGLISSNSHIRIYLLRFQSSISTMFSFTSL